MGAIIKLKGGSGTVLFGLGFFDLRLRSFQAGQVNAPRFASPWRRTGNRKQLPRLYCQSSFAAALSVHIWRSSHGLSSHASLKAPQQIHYAGTRPKSQACSLGPFPNHPTLKSFRPNSH